jgi:hypothetical protein
MNFLSITRKYVFLVMFFFSAAELWAVYPNTCPTMQKRNNGNGLWGSCAGQGGVAVAANVVGTSYANFFSLYSITPSTKTGDINFYWPGVTNITELYVITRVWIGTTILNTKVGPPPVPEIRNGNTYATYCFYVANLPNAGVLTLEFTNPVTNQPVSLCSYDLKTGATATIPVSCAPTINSEPSSKAICSDTTSFRINASGASTYQWQRFDGSTWSNITSGPFTGYNSSVLNITSSASTYSGNKFRVILTGTSGTCSTTSNEYTLTAYPKPTATFAAGAIVCGVGTYNLRINFTGTAPWSFTYTADNGATSTTISNIAASPYYLAVSPAATTTYKITALNDRYCANYSSSNSVSIVVQDKPTITLSSSTVYYCYSNVQGTATLNYTSTTNSPTQYSITPGTRSMGGFNNVLNASNTFNSGSGSVSITIPASIAAGTYDFNIRVKVASPGSGCESVDVPFTIIIRPAPSIAATSSASSVCLNGSVTLSATPDLSSSGYTYAWTGATVASPTAVSTSATVTASPSTYTVTVTQPSTGCTASGSVTVTLKAGASITVNSPTICSGDRAVLTAAGGVTYSWSLSPSGSASSTLSSTTGSTVLANPTSTNTYRVTGTSSTGCAGFADAVVTVNSGLNVTVTASATICPGGSINLTAGGATDYSWAPASSLSASTGATVTATPSTTTTYTVTGTTGSCSGSASTTVTVYTPPVSATPPQNIAFCNGDMNGNDLVQLNVTTTSSVQVVWEYLASSTWTAITSTATNDARYRNNAVGTSTNSFTLNLKNAAFTSTSETKYRVGVVAGGCTTYYYTTLVNLSATPTFDVASAQTICSGSAPTALSSNVTFSNGTSSNNYTTVYQWQSSTDGSTFNNISGATSSTYQPPALSVNTWYRVGVSASAGNCTSVKYSTSVKITVVSSISGNTISGTDCPSGPATLTGSTITGGTYIWQSSTNGSTYNDIAGAVSQNYTASGVLTQKTWFRRKASVGSCTDISSAVALTPAVLGNEISSGQTVCSGTALSTLGPVAPTGGTGSYTYQWESSATGSSWGAEAGATSNSYSPTVAAGTTKYFRVVVTSGSCASISNQSIITVNALPTISTTGGNVSVCQGLSTTLTATGGVSYTWSPNTELNVTAGEKVISTPTATRTYTISGTDANGCSSTGTVTVTYNAAPAAPTSLTASSTQCYTGTPSVDLSTTFISGTVSYPLEYQWFNESTNPPSASPVSNPTSSSGTYYAFTKNTSTGCFSATYITATLTLISNDAPSPLLSSYSACSPATYNLRSAEPTAPSGTTWVWRTGNTIGSSAPADPTAVGSGTYYLFGTNGSCTTAASAAVTVTINNLPTVTVSPATESACAPNTVNITNNYTGVGGEIYQWYTASSNPTPATLVTDPSSVGAGTYYLYATNTSTMCQTASPNSVVVTINSRPTLTITAPSVSCIGPSNSVSITTSATLSPTAYEWFSINTSNNTRAKLSNATPYSGTTTHTLTINPANDDSIATRLYYFKAITSQGCESISDHISIPLQSDVSCSSQPSNRLVSTLPNGTYFSFTVSDFNATIQWQVSTNGGTVWRNLTENYSASVNGVKDSLLYIGVNTTRLDLPLVHDSMNDFKYRAIASTSPCINGCTTSIATLNTPISLPVSGVMLQAHREQNNLKLRWVAFSEQDVASYDVQYASDAVNFRNIDKVVVASPAFTTKEYNVLTRPIPGYYRIQANGNMQGDRAFSNTVYFNDRELIKTGLHPNPAVSGEVAVNMTGLLASEMPAEVSIFSVEGRLLQKTTMVLKNGNNNLKLNAAVQERPLVLVRIHQPEIGEMLHTKLMIAR